MHRNNERPLTTPKLPFVENGLEWLLMTQCGHPQFFGHYGLR
jgi:hypothetical protein